MSRATPTFPSREGQAFLADVRAAVSEDFAARAVPIHADRAVTLRTVLLLAVTFGSWAVIMANLVPPLGALALTVVIGLGIAGIGFAVGHDALHGSTSDDSRLNAVLGCSMDLIGASSYLWRITHNVIHHTYTNIHGTDEDLAVSPLLRLSPHADRRWFHRWQHWYAPLLYSFTTLYWVFVKDWKYLAARDLGPFKDRHHRARDVAGLLAGKVIFYGWSLVLPFMLVEAPWYGIAAGILLAHLVAGTTLGLVFQLAHVVEETAHPLPDGAGAMPQNWAVHEMETTANFAPRSRLLNWYVAGLNFQIEHHLFPKICSIHYPRLAPIVRAAAQRHGLPYHSHPTFLAALRSHLVTLKAFGARA